jgi:hypothetical protein
MKHEQTPARLRPMTMRRWMIVVVVFASIFGIVRWLWHLEYAERSGWVYTWEAVRRKTYGEWIMEKMSAGMGFFSS